MTDREIEFQGGVRSLIIILSLIILVLLAMTLVSRIWELGPMIPHVDTNLLSSLLRLSLIGIIWWALQTQGIRPSQIGLSLRLILPAIVAVSAYFFALNIVGIGLAVLAGHPEAAGYIWDLPPILLTGYVIFHIFFAGFIEEIVFWGYLQTKCIALLGGERRAVLIGILLASALFAAVHLPRAFWDPPGGEPIAPYMLTLFISGILFGVLYEATQNLYIAIIWHGFGNFPVGYGPIFISFRELPAWADVTFWIAYFGLAVVLILGYRRWGYATGTMPVWTTRREVATYEGRRRADVSQ